MALMSITTLLPAVATKTKCDHRRWIAIGYMAYHTSNSVQEI